MVWFWQTRQRSSEVMRTMRASSAGSAASGAASLACAASAAARQRRSATGEPPAPLHQASSFFSSGSILLASTSGVSGPMCFMRITPLPSMTKVSGTP